MIGDDQEVFEYTYIGPLNHLFTVGRRYKCVKAHGHDHYYFEDNTSNGKFNHNISAEFLKDDFEL